MIKFSLLQFLLIFSILWNDSGAAYFEFRALDQGLKEACKKGARYIDHAMDQGPQRVAVRNMVNAVKNGTGRTYNWSIGTKNGKYVLAVRVNYVTTPGAKIIPGNNESSRFEKGQNFWWEDWQSEKFSGGTLYFLSDNDFSSFKLLIPLQAAPEVILRQDLRLMNEGDKLFIYNPRDTWIAQEISDTKDIEGTGIGLITFSNNMIKNHKPGNNYGMIKITNDYYMYLDWIYLEGVKYIKAHLNETEKEALEEKYLPYESTDYRLLGTGSTEDEYVDVGENKHIMPLFSFGTPHVKLDDNTYFGVGHIKIPTDDNKYAYEAFSNIETFRKNLYSDFKSAYGDKYVRHDAYFSQSNTRRGYNYLMYFYYFNLNENDEITQMKISDAYLPVDLSASPDDYKFSLIFPMGLALSADQKNIVISAGYGDYSSALMQIDRDKALEWCHHNIQNLNLRDYKYNIIGTDNGQVFIANRLKDILQQK